MLINKHVLIEYRRFIWFLCTALNIIIVHFQLNFPYKLKFIPFYVWWTKLCFPPSLRGRGQWHSIVYELLSTFRAHQMHSLKWLNQTIFEIIYWRKIYLIFSFSFWMFATLLLKCNSILCRNGSSFDVCKKKNVNVYLKNDEPLNCNRKCESE